MKLMKCTERVIHVPSLPIDVCWLCHPLAVGRPPLTLSYRFIFDEWAVYDHGNEDQWDWNKGGGLGAWRRMDNMCMVAWRYVEGRFEVGPYWHPAGAARMRKQGEAGRVMPEDRGVLYVVDPGEPLYVQLVAVKGEPYHMRFLYKGQATSVTCEGTHAPWLVREVSAWFGGTSMPPKVVMYRRKRKIG